MKNKTNYLTLLAAVSILAPLASAQVAGTVATTAQTAATASQNAAAMSAQQAAAASSHAATASAASATAAATGAQISAAHSPATTGVTSTAAAATTAAGASIPTTKGTVNAGVANSATVPGNKPTDESSDVSTSAKLKANGTAAAPGLSADGNAHESASASLNGAATAAQIRNATKESREQIFAHVDTSIETTKRSLAQLRQSSRELNKEAREQFKTASEDVRVREKALRQSLKAARHATPDEAAAAQAKLAADYEGYATAVAMTESALHGSVSTTAGGK